MLGLPQLFVESESLTRLDVQFRSPNAVAVLLTLAQTVPLLWRRRYPRAVLAVTIAAATVHLLLGFQPTWAEVGMLIALYTVAAHCPGRRAAVAGLAAGAALVVYGVFAEPPLPELVPGQPRAGRSPSSSSGPPGSWARAERRLAYTAKLEALNDQLATEQELRSRWAVAEERG